MEIFVVEDSPLLRERLTRIFGQIRGVQVGGQAATATEAVERINKTHPDVVVLDIRLAQGNGFQVLKDIKQSPESPYVIVLTNYPYPPYRKRFLEQGADYFFDKSTELPQAIEALKLLREVVSTPGGSNEPSPVASGSARDAMPLPPRRNDSIKHSHYNYPSLHQTH